ncbi:putative protein YloA [bioreactor metagenome]|uniref:NFACT RNA-binding domain-containing protein n=1 Tax=bioreactor metagenome TaxID=1076179 RepID=A0A644Z8X8_9ZZZZ
MAMDAICLSAVVRELAPVLAGGKIDKIYEPSRDEVVLQVRGTGGNVRLLLSASPVSPRIQLTALSRENPESPPMFCMLLRKHLIGGRVRELTQPPMERMTELFLETTDEMGDKTVRSLVLEAMGRHSNLILLDAERRIVDCLRRVDGDITGGRRLLPGMFYRPPEPHPGIPPLLARELEFRGVSDLAEGLRKWARDVEEGRYTPTMLLREGKTADFSFLPILQYGPGTEWKEYKTFSELLDDFYETRTAQEYLRQRGQELKKHVTALRDRTVRKIQNQELELKATYGRQRLRELGDIITANLHIMEKGMKVLRALDFYDPDGREADVNLDPLLTPQQNAAKYYKEYNKAKKAEEMLTIQLEKGRRELDYLNSVLEGIALAEGERDLREIRQELAETGYLRRSSKAKGREKAASGKPMEFRSGAGLRITVGKNNTQNDLLTTKSACKTDLWFHTQKIHGSHVILWTEGEDPDQESVLEAAKLAAWFSQGRENSKVPVDYTPVRYVKKPAGARPGMVVYTTYRTLLVSPDEALVKRLRVK